MSNETLFSSQRDELQKCECHLQSKGGTRNSAICRYSFVRYERYSLTATIKMSNFVADGLNGNSKRIDNNELYLSFSPKINTIFADRYFLDLTGSIDWRKPLNNQLYAGYTDTWTYQFGLGFRTEIFAKIDFDTDFSIIKRNGFVNNELNHAMCEWDMSLSRSFMNDKICLKLKAVDILQQYKSVAYMTNEQGIRETHAVVLPGYVLFTASYRFNKQPKKK